jgi:hypothetical protein
MPVLNARFLFIIDAVPDEEGGTGRGKKAIQMVLIIICLQFLSNSV